ncbi:hypothetical protein O4H49_09515 [Kiloniella laminariae]|uniref:Uncharacterized protein n=1 Tax=Kiloniella laminariae TaxID=454162 RepID=A0ABT4LIT4_9PROT|nr:hypothetical protein [Kiloniella laminariae]MCZ4281014.1 hypothetical protein [Kiloniella laminariae]
MKSHALCQLVDANYGKPVILFPDQHSIKDGFGKEYLNFDRTPHDYPHQGLSLWLFAESKTAIGMTITNQVSNVFL